jgi:hypothetical protein
MQKLTSLIIALIPAAVVLTGGVFLYSLAPTTPMLIILLLGSFASVILGVVIYNRKTGNEQSKSIKIIEWGDLAIEEDTLPIFPEEFVTRMRPESGALWLLNEQLKTDLRLESSVYDKLKNITTLKFNRGYQLELKKCSLIMVGDNQLTLKDFDQLHFCKNNKVLFSVLNFGKYWVVERDKSSYNYSGSGPIIVFQWED